MFLSESDISAIALTCKLAFIVTIILLVICTPLAWWLSQTKSRLKGPISALIALPLVLPPTVLGFYLLVSMGPNGFIGTITQQLGIGLLPFTFWGLVFGSVIYSLPFVLQPLQASMEMLDTRLLEAAATLRVSPLERFFTIVVPLAKQGFLSAAVLGFAHTVGEFGLILMIGGNIEQETRVVSVQIYDHVEALEYTHAHGLAGLMVAFSFVALLFLYSMNRKRGFGGNLNYGS